MSVTPWVPTVRTIKDGEDVSQSVVNVPLNQLIQREQHLYEKFDQLEGKSVLVSFGKPIYPTELTGANPVRDGKLDIVYYRSDTGGDGLCRAQTGFSSTNTNGMYSPNKSNYAFGILKAVSPSGLGDCYLEGLCELSTPIDDLTNGLIESENGVVETFEVGPYYISRKYPGKITKNPAGIPTYVGYAISKTSFLLGPSVDEFSQFFINYRYNILDRPVATPVLTSGVWTIPTTSNPNRLGWIQANSTNLPGYTIPTSPTGKVAKFFYYIPSNIAASDSLELTSLSASEIAEANELRGLLPPVPANFVQLLANGITQRLCDTYTPDGIYTIDNYGIWWFENTQYLQPWADDILTGYPSWSPNNWPAYQGTSYTRPRLYLSFSKFNPALRTQLVSSVTPFNNLSDYGVADANKNNSANFISFYNSSNKTVSSPTGDLMVKVTPQFVNTGNSGAFTAPTTQTSTYTANRAVADLSYDNIQGKFVKSVTPVVSKITGTGGINITEVTPNSGNYTIGYLDQGMSGLVDSIEPINSRLEFRGLSSYIKLPYNAVVTVPYGLIGKVILPKNSLSGVPMNLVMQVFGASGYAISSSNTGLTFNFEYSCTTAQNSSAAADKLLINNLVRTASQASSVVSTVLTDSSVSAYTAYTPVNLTGNFIIPASYVSEDTVINFKITRSVGATSNYTGDIGILGIYWNVTSV